MSIMVFYSAHVLIENCFYSAYAQCTYKELFSDSAHVHTTHMSFCYWVNYRAKAASGDGRDV